MNNFVVEVSVRGEALPLGFTKLWHTGGRGCVPLTEATRMTFAEAWLVMREIERNPTPECVYEIREIGVTIPAVGNELSLCRV